MSNVTELLCDAVRCGQALDESLHRFVLETRSRASGLWRLRDGHLEMIGFASVDDMPRDVHHGFIETTRRVSLEQNHFGIVRAVNTGGPTLAQRDPGDTGLTGSASWLAKFACQTSLAVPVRHPATNAILGALAVSTTDTLHPHHPFWNSLVELAATLGRALANEVVPPGSASS